MPPKLRLVVAGAAVLVGAAWYWFRPERAVIDRSVDESAPAATMRRLASGRFVPQAHEGRGLAEVWQLEDGRRVLRLSDFETLDGPDLQVYLLGRAEVSGAAELAAAGFVSLGALKGNIGSQNYEIPEGTDLASYPAVSVWCRRFAVNFTTASLSADTAAVEPRPDDRPTRKD